MNGHCAMLSSFISVLRSFLTGKHNLITLILLSQPIFAQRNGSSNPTDRFKLYAGSGSYCLGTNLSHFQLKTTVCTNFCGVVPNYYSQVLLTSIPVFSTLRDRSFLVIPIFPSFEYRLLGLEFENFMENKVSN